MLRALSNTAWMVLMAEGEVPGSGGPPAGAPPTPAPTGSSTPETTPSVPSQATETPLTEGEGEPSEKKDDWEELLRDSDGEDLAEGPATPPVTAQEPLQPPIQEPPAQAPAQPAPQPTAQPPAQQPVQPQETAEQRDARARAAAEARQAQLENWYQLPEDDAAALQTEPEKVLPKIAARLHQAVEHAVRQQLEQALPGYVKQVQEFQQTEDRAQQEFNSAWPGLAGYKEQVVTVGRMFRAANPNATKEQAIDTVGRMTYMALGLPLPEAPQAGSPAPAVPQLRVVRQPFKPAMPGGSGPAAAPKETNEFARLAEELLEDDRGG